ncbi:MAG: type III-B CRISPR module RAMP protein Cmr6 [Chloroflexales bacterium]
MPELSLRADVARLRPTSVGANAGLWLDRFLPEQLTAGEHPPPRDEHPHTKHIKAAAEIGEPAVYKPFFTRWLTALDDLPQYERVKTGEAVARGRVVVGLGAEGVLENAITLHRAYGVPYIPGSALKGLAAAYAHRRLLDNTWRKEVRNKAGEVITSLGDAHKIVFGDTTTAGYVTFFDALYVPGSAAPNRPLLPDVLTVHHPKYYQGGDEAEAPADWDSPTPISFISATGCFLVALAGPAQWVDTAYDILALALDELGVGGKTAAGYGRMTLDGLDAVRTRLGGSLSSDTEETPKDQSTPTNHNPDIAVADALIARINGLADNRVAGEINKFYQEAQALTINAVQYARIAAAMITKVQAAGREKASADRPWYKALLLAVQGSDVVTKG